MSSTVAMLLTAALGGVLFWGIARAQWARVAKQLEQSGFTVRSSLLSNVLVFEGTRGERPVRGEMRRESGTRSEPTLTHVKAITDSGLPCRGRIVFGPREATSGRDVATGDAVFDGFVGVAGEPAVVSALMTPELRRHLADVVAYEPSLNREGELSVRTVDQSEPKALYVEAAADQVVALYEAIERVGSIEEGLVRRIAGDPSEGVRRLALERLLEMSPGSAVLEQALRAALEDPDPGVRLAGTRVAEEAGLAAEGSTAELALTLLAEETTPDRVAAEALGEALASCSDDAGIELLRRVLATSWSTTRVVALEEVTERELTELASLVESCLASRSVSVVEAAVTALQALGARADEPLARLLDRHEEPVNEAALRALKVSGTVSVVPKLVEYADSELNPERLRALARLVTKAIRARSGGVAGGLSVIGSGEAGALSVADGDGRGGLSLREGETLAMSEVDGAEGEDE